jgi:hypothetical protein
MPQVSTIHSRDEVLSVLLPKILGLLWDKGVAQSGHGKDVIGRQIEVSVDLFRPNGFLVSVYAPTSKSPVDKVFSGHLAPDPGSVDPSFFKYQGGRCGVLSWKRGEWEDIIANAVVRERDLAQLAEFPYHSHPSRPN